MRIRAWSNGRHQEVLLSRSAFLVGSSTDTFPNKVNWFLHSVRWWPEGTACNEEEYAYRQQIHLSGKEPYSCCRSWCCWRWPGWHLRLLSSMGMGWMSFPSLLLHAQSCLFLLLWSCVTAASCSTTELPLHCDKNSTRNWEEQQCTDAFRRAYEFVVVIINEAKALQHSLFRIACN